MPTPPRSSAAASSSRASAAPELRRLLLQMVIGVVLLDAVALVLKSRLLVDAWPESRRLVFTGAWMIATLGVVGTFLMRIRAARVRARHARSGAGRTS